VTETGAANSALDLSTAFCSAALLVRSTWYLSWLAITEFASAHRADLLVRCLP
jgi:hypothetical protein